MDKKNSLHKNFSFNFLKHHLLSVKKYFGQEKFQTAPNSAVKKLVLEFKTIGNNITDIYTGSMSIQNIFKEISYNLKSQNQYEFNEFTKLFLKNEYFKIKLSDGSVWIIRQGKNRKEYIHIHPARAGLHTIRFPASTWKTALICYYFELYDSDFGFNLNTINYLRTSFLELPPLKRIKQNDNICAAYSLLSGTIQGLNSFSNKKTS